jgi:ABC-type phosphate transport system ATPase subunit
LLHGFGHGELLRNDNQVGIQLLPDEPTSTLDPISAGHIERQLFALKQDYVIVFVTHTLRQAR